MSFHSEGEKNKVGAMSAEGDKSPVGLNTVNNALNLSAAAVPQKMLPGKSKFHVASVDWNNNFNNLTEPLPTGYEDS